MKTRYSCKEGFKDWRKSHQGFVILFLSKELGFQEEIYVFYGEDLRG